MYAFLIHAKPPSDRAHRRLMRRVSRTPLSQRRIERGWPLVVSIIAVLGALIAFSLWGEEITSFLTVRVLFPLMIAWAVGAAITVSIAPAMGCNPRDRLLQRPDLAPEGFDAWEHIHRLTRRLDDRAPLSDDEYRELRARLGRASAAGRAIFGLLAVLLLSYVVRRVLIGNGGWFATVVLFGTGLPAVSMLWFFNNHAKRGLLRLMSRPDLWDPAHTHLPVHMLCDGHAYRDALDRGAAPAPNPSA